MKKKILMFLLMGTMALSLAACGDEGSKKAKTKVEVDDEDEDEDEEEEEEEEEEEKKEKKSKKDKEETAESIAEEAIEAVEETEEALDETETGDAAGIAEVVGDAIDFSIGKTTSNVYENEFLNVRFTPLAGMKMATDAELAQLSATTADVLQDVAAAKEQLDKGNVLIACYASSDNTKKPVQTFNITMQNVESLGLGGKSALSNISEEQILNAAVDSVAGVLEQNGFTNLKTDIDTINFLGEEHPCMVLTAEIPGYGEFYEREVVTIRNGYIASFTSSVIGGDDTTIEILDQVTDL